MVYFENGEDNKVMAKRTYNGRTRAAFGKIVCHSLSSPPLAVFFVRKGLVSL